MHYQRVIATGDPGPPGRRTFVGDDNPNWKGGVSTGGQDGNYVLRYAPDHPAASVVGYVLEHRLIMEAHLGRYLTADEVVHHANDDTRDNRIENLELKPHQADHAREHALTRRRRPEGTFA